MGGERKGGEGGEGGGGRGYKYIYEMIRIRIGNGIVIKAIPQQKKGIVMIFWIAR